MPKRAATASILAKAKKGYVRWRTPGRGTVKKVARRLGIREYRDALQRELAWTNSQIQTIRAQLEKPLDRETREQLDHSLFFYKNMGRWLNRGEVNPDVAISPKFWGELGRKARQWSFHFASQKAELSKDERAQLKKEWAALLRVSQSHPNASPDVRFNLFEKKVGKLLKDQRKTEQFLEIFGIYNRLLKRTQKEINSLRPNRKPAGIEEEQ